MVALVITSGETTWGYWELQVSRKVEHGPWHYKYNSTIESCGKITGWDIQGLISDKNKLQAAQSEWTNLSQNRHIIGDFCTQQDLDDKVGWVESSVTSILNSYCKPIRVNPFSKKW